MNKIEVLAVEIKQYVGKDQKTMVPRVIGQTAKTQEKKTGSSINKRKVWNREIFLEEILSSLSSNKSDVLKTILKFCEKHKIWFICRRLMFALAKKSFV